MKRIINQNLNSKELMRVVCWMMRLVGGEDEEGGGET